MTYTKTDTTACLPDPDFMRNALDEAHRSAERGNLGVGAILVIGNQIVARGGNEESSANDPFAHAEIQVLKDFLQSQPKHLLQHATLYTTFEPCPMCLGACLAVGLGAIAVGGTRSPQDRQWGGYRPEDLAELIGSSGPKIKVQQGPYRDECVLVRSESLEEMTKTAATHMIHSEDKK